jgi:hypothetical protein
MSRFQVVNATRPRATQDQPKTNAAGSMKYSSGERYQAAERPPRLGDYGTEVWRGPFGIRTPALPVLAVEDEAVDAAQVAVALGVVHPVADDEIVGDVEPGMGDGQLQRGRRWLAQERAQREARGPELP